jgi:hypothetical protein
MSSINVKQSLVLNLFIQSYVVNDISWKSNENIILKKFTIRHNFIMEYPLD